jgi:hypothetical protein
MVEEYEGFDVLFFYKFLLIIKNDFEFNLALSF